MSSNIILEAVLLCSVPPFLCHKFYIQLALPISPEIMDGFWCSRCLNNRIKVSNMMRLFSGGARTPWWWKFELNNPRWKLFTTINKIITSGRILVFEVSIEPYWSARNDRIICKWRQCTIGSAVHLCFCIYFLMMNNSKTKRN